MARILIWEMLKAYFAGGSTSHGRPHLWKESKCLICVFSDLTKKNKQTNKPKQKQQQKTEQKQAPPDLIFTRFQGECESECASRGEVWRILVKLLFLLSSSSTFSIFTKPVYFFLVHPDIQAYPTLLNPFPCSVRIYFVFAQFPSFHFAIIKVILSSQVKTF